MQKQTRCFWPSGKAINHMNSFDLRSLLRSFGVESPEIDALVGSPEPRANGQLPKLVSRLKRESHENGDCECPNAASIRAGGGAVKGVRLGHGATRQV